jgi:hypothetical protein
MTHRSSELAYWINEREAMRERKENAERSGTEYWQKANGWSDDPAMGLVRYCNVRREDDKVTKWIAENWRNPNAKDPNLTLAMVMARMINWPETLAKIGYPKFSAELTLSGLQSQKTIMKGIEGKKWTSAYTISTCGRRMGKEDYVFDHVLRQVAEEPWKIRFEDAVPGTLSQAHQMLMEVDGLGSFLAAQVVADLKNTPGHPLAGAPDWWTWSAHGPGSLRGLAVYYGRPVTPSNYQQAISQAYKEVVPLINVGPLHMQDFQNCLCEFSKFMRVKEGDGRVRNTYTAG